MICRTGIIGHAIRKQRGAVMIGELIVIEGLDGSGKMTVRYRGDESKKDIHECNLEYMN
ncbi:MAG: hypothetical protein Q4C77_05685 [Eubacteriales bacterium]|nr:hypothetical protein [Eubacteriales bacterium]